MTTAGTISQEGIETMIAKAAAMPSNPITLTSMTKEVKEATVSHNRSFSRSRFSSRSRSLSFSLSSDSKRSYDHYHAEDPNMDIDEGENSLSSYTDPTKHRWKLEMARAKPKTKGKDNRIVGFGLFYKKHPFNYSKKEFLAEQGH
eukprot:14730815-Ditylum_brightwellii.AAC.1